MEIELIKTINYILLFHYKGKVPLMYIRSPKIPCQINYYRVVRGMRESLDESHPKS